MSVRTKYLLGEIPVTINDNDKQAIIIKVMKKYPQLTTLKGRGFELTEEKHIICVCPRSEYNKKVKELEKLLYEIEFKTLQIEDAIKEIKKSKKKKEVKKEVKKEEPKEVEEIESLAETNEDSEEVE